MQKRGGGRLRPVRADQSKQTGLYGSIRRVNRGVTASMRKAMHVNIFYETQNRSTELKLSII